MKKIKKIIPVVIILGIIALVAYRYLNKEGEEINYSLFTVEKTDISQTIAATGEVTGADLTFYSIKQTEEISEVLVKEGDIVLVDDILIRFDIDSEKDDLLRDIQSAKLSMAAAQLQLESIELPASGNTLLQYEGDIQSMEKNLLDAQNDFDSIQIQITKQIRETQDSKQILDRHILLHLNDALSDRDLETSTLAYNASKDLLEDLYIDKRNKENMIVLRNEQLDNATSKLANAKNAFSDEKVKISADLQRITLEQAKLELSRLESQLDDLVSDLTAKTKGTVKSVNVEVGEYATKGQLLIEIENVESLLVEADISEFDSLHIALGQGVIITSAGLADSSFHGVVESISAHAIKKETSSGDEVFVPVTIKMEDKTPFKSGFTVDIDLIIDKRTEILAIPIQSVVTEENQLVYVYVLEKTDEDNQTNISKREIEIGFMGDRMVEVTKGLKEGEDIVQDISVININNLSQP